MSRVAREGITSSGASSRLTPKRTRKLFPLPAGGDRTFGHLPRPRAVAGSLGRPGPPSRSPMHHAPRLRVAGSEKCGKKPVDNGDIGNNNWNLLFADSSRLSVADPFPSAYLEQVPECPALAPEPAYLQGLNPPQREAVLTTEGPVLVLAGAGTGKTAALTARLAHLIATRKAWPSQILAVTFTNKAAREMKERVSAISGGAIEGMPWLGTFHSVAARMLRSHAELVGLQSNFTILDTDDQLRVLKQLIQSPRTSTRSAGPRASSPASSTAGRTAAGLPSRSTPASPKRLPPVAAPNSTRHIRSG